VCPACQQLGETDVRNIDIHPNADHREVQVAPSGFFGFASAI
jgi:hypothetical protein